MIQDHLPTVLFDADCPFCRMLAELSARRSLGQLRFESWQEFSLKPEAQELGEELQSRPADKLRVLTAQGLLENDQAWRWLLEGHPDLKGIGWIAEKLGLMDPAAKVLNRGGHALRWLCRKCHAHK